jgi:hypothetical protein
MPVLLLRWRQRRADVNWGVWAMSSQMRSFRAADLVALALCYLWYNPAVHLMVVRVFC